MPTITGPTRQPDDVTPLEGTWHVQLATLEGTALGTDGSVRAATYDAVTVAGVATATLPASGPDDAYLATFKAKGRRLELGPYGPFKLETNMTWGEVVDVPTLQPVEPSMATRAETAAQAAEDEAAAAAVAAAEVTEIAAQLVRFTDLAGHPIPTGLVTISVDTTTGQIADITYQGA